MTTTTPPRGSSVPRASVVYPSPDPLSSDVPQFSARDRVRAAILARLASAGMPLELSRIRDCGALFGLSSTGLLSALRDLIRLGLVLQVESSEVVTIDGIRRRRDFTLYCPARSGGG